MTKRIELYPYKSTVRVPVWQYNDMTRIAREQNVPRTHLLRQWVRDYLPDFPPEPIQNPSDTTVSYLRLSEKWEHAEVTLRVTFSEEQVASIKEARFYTGQTFPQFIQMIVKLNTVDKSSATS